MSISAILGLEDGTIFKGVSIGADGSSIAEVVFNTSMTGYQEILTDPSYARQMITLTYPHIGNTGVNSEDEESDNVWCEGVIIRDLPLTASSWRSEESLDTYLKRKGVVGIADIDTRKLTRILREKGAQAGCIMTGKILDEAEIIAASRRFPGLKGTDLAKEVSAKESYQWTESTWDLVKGHSTPKAFAFHVVAYDFGVKRNILRSLVERGCRLTVVPAHTPAADVLALNPDGVFLSNGPGDPEPCDYAIQSIKEILDTAIPVFGICLGHQLLALASGAKTKKMKFGHHGANHPVQAIEKATVMITSQNHGFSVDENTLPANLVMTHTSLCDGSLQGIARIDKRAYSFQGHPESSPGTHDVAPLFDQFIENIKATKKA